jgi:viroplasmin and RNaseH domain-containing protein
METQEKRNLNLALMTEQSEIITFLNNMYAEDFVKLHQDNFKDHYLSEPPMLLDNSIFDDLDLRDIIREKYNEFFKMKGVDETYKWLNPSLFSNWSEYLKSEDFSKDEILHEVWGKPIDDESIDACYDKFSELYYDFVSGWGLSWFIIEVVTEYVMTKPFLSTIKN